MKFHLPTAALISVALLVAAYGPTVVAYAADHGERVVAVPNPEPPPLIGVPAQFGYSVAAFKTAADELVIVSGAPFDLVGDVEAGAVHLIDGTTGDLIRTIPNPAPETGDQFGWSVAVDEYGNIIASAPLDDDPDGPGPIPAVVNAGTVFVFDTYGNELHTIPNPAPASGDQFGAAVAVDQHGNIIVGAMRDDDPDGPGPTPAVQDTGTVFVFDGATGALRHTIPSVSGNAWDWFGMAVTAFGDKIFVGDPYYPDPSGNLGPLGGAVRVFDGATGSLLDTWANPYPPDDASWDQFGSRLAVDETRGEILNGAFLDDDPDGPGGIPAVLNAGSVFVHDGATGTIRHTIWNPAPGVRDYFGRSVAVAGGRYVVGAEGDNDPDGPDPIPAVVDAGSVFVFDAETAALLHTIWNPAPGVGDRFGRSVAIVDRNIVVGAFLDDDPDGPGPIPTVVDAGAAFVFDAETGERRLTIESPGGLVPATKDQFGSAVVVSSDRIIVGAPQDSLDTDGPGGAEAVVGAGSVYVLNKGGQLLLILPNPAPGVGDNFGASVAVDRYGNIIVGAPSDDDPDGPGTIPEVPDAGAVFVFDSKGSLLHTIQDPNRATGDQFGAAVAVDRYGNIIVGDPRDDDPVDYAGAVFVFDGSGSHLYTIQNPAPASGDRFGSSVAVDRRGNIIVGADQDADPDGPGPIPPVAEAGSAFVFQGTTGELLHTLFDPDRAPVDLFGRSVAVDRRGNIIVGIPLKRTDGVNGGAVFLFDARTGAPLRTIANPAPKTGDYFGDSVAVEANGNIIVGAPLDDDPDGPGPIPAVANAGAAFVFNGATGALVRIIANPAPETGDLFGDTVAVGSANDDDELLAIGAPFDDDADGPGPLPEALNAGAVFLFRGGDNDD